MTAFASCCMLYLALLAVASPTPWWKHSAFGGVAVTACTIMLNFLNSYLRASITAVIKDDDPSDESRLFWSGFCAQAGAFIGTLIVFPLINVFKVFESAEECFGE
ncbi:hypothetical protein AAVH_33730 [Aphelenchoides avenae]|nr:hypothetical protein AAVH_33730 [Aphelenchus avenae]